MKPKLIRDKIPEIIRKDGKKPIIHIAKDDEYWDALKEKLSEEVNEFLEDDNVEELADILEVLISIAEYNDINMEEIEIIRKIKAKNRGTFKKKIILDKIE